MASNAPWPTELRLKDKGSVFRILFEDGQAYELNAEFLRVFSPSAEVQGHGPKERKIIGGKRSVAIAAVEPVGNYAVKLVFDDGHATGIYTWSYLAELGLNQQAWWGQYLESLEAKGLSRDKAGESFALET